LNNRPSGSKSTDDENKNEDEDENENEDGFLENFEVENIVDSISVEVNHLGAMNSLFKLTGKQDGSILYCI
jgi:hypothetical protein